MRNNDEEYAVVANNLTKRFYKKGGKNPYSNHKTEETFYALQDLSFKVAQGEILGILGLNGAGKTTLLKILSGITSPSSGNYSVPVRTVGILEAGAGFNPELSGLDNITFYAGLFGVNANTIRQKIPEITEFSGIGDFINAPVKQYSNGMFVRLAFSILIHIDADLYLFDEVLSVGDLSFRTKAMEYLTSLKSRQKTALIVTHSPVEIAPFCDRFLVLNQGNLHFLGESVYALNLATQLRLGMKTEAGSIRSESASQSLLENQLGSGTFINQNAETDHRVSIRKFWIENDPAKSDQSLSPRNLSINTDLRINSIDEPIGFLFILNDWNSYPVAAINSEHSDQFPELSLPGDYSIKCTLPDNILSNGNYAVDLFVTTRNTTIVTSILKVISFSVNRDSGPAKPNTLKIISPASILPEVRWEKTADSN